jgi:large subunit ribosomal protein L18
MNLKKQRRQIRVRHSINQGESRPRLTVHRSNRYVSAQLIDDTKRETIIGMSEKTLKVKGTKTEKAKALGLELASKIKSKKISKIVFDRGSYSYHGRVKSVAEGLREGGLDF